MAGELTLSEGHSIAETSSLPRSPLFQPEMNKHIVYLKHVIWKLNTYLDNTLCVVCLTCSCALRDSGA